MIQQACPDDLAHESTQVNWDLTDVLMNMMTREVTHPSPMILIPTEGRMLNEMTRARLLLGELARRSNLEGGLKRSGIVHAPPKDEQAGFILQLHCQLLHVIVQPQHLEHAARELVRPLDGSIHGSWTICC